VITYTALAAMRASSFSQEDTTMKKISMQEIWELLREWEADPLVRAMQAFDAAIEQTRLAQAYLKLDRLLEAQKPAGDK
jgi:hypothetical protein